MVVGLPCTSLPHVLPKTWRLVDVLYALVLLLNYAPRDHTCLLNKPILTASWQLVSQALLLGTTCGEAKQPDTCGVGLTTIVGSRLNDIFATSSTNGHERCNVFRHYPHVDSENLCIGWWCLLHTMVHKLTIPDIQNTLRWHALVWGLLD